MQTSPAIEAGVLTEYAQRIPLGSRVRLERTDGRTLRGTLIKASAQAITVQRHTRIPETPVEVPLASVARLTLDSPNGMSAGKAIGIGIASGVGAFLAILGIFAATFND